VILQVADALEADQVHKLIHRDIKPANISYPHLVVPKPIVESGPGPCAFNHLLTKEFIRQQDRDADSAKRRGFSAIIPMSCASNGRPEPNKCGDSRLDNRE
jgi:hypothetical protein